MHYMRLVNHRLQSTFCDRSRGCKWLLLLLHLHPGMLMAAAAASSSSSDSHWKYDVFLNFRGLEAAACSSSAISTKLMDPKAINTFINAEELQKATTFRSSWQLLATQAFDPSFFSENYASSTWCLKELVQIMECVDAHKQIVVPVLYGVDPSDIRKQEVLLKLLLNMNVILTLA